MADTGHSIINDVFAELDSAEWLRDDAHSHIMLLKKRFEETTDVESELRKLHAVQNLDGLAKRLLWVVDLARRGSDLALVDEAKSQALAEARRCFGTEPLTEEFDASKVADESANSVQPGGGEFGMTFEKFVIAMQSGDELRESYLNGLLEQCESLKNSPDAGPILALADEVGSFLSFIKENDLMDDVRVMNILSNLGDSVSRGLNAPQEQLEGFISEAVEVIKDFKTLFE